jgi:hypothetical protein
VSDPAGDLPKRHPRQLVLAAVLWTAWLVFLAITAFRG